MAQSEAPTSARSVHRQAWISALLVALLTLCVVVLSQRLRWRLDLTEENRYSLAPATLQLLDRLEDRLDLVLYFNQDIEGAEALLPVRLLIQDFLDELAAYGGDKVVVRTVDPTTDLLARQDAEHAKIAAVPFQELSVGALSVAELYQGLEMRYQDRSEVIPFIRPERMEFAFAVRLASLIEKQRPVIGFFSREPPAPPLMPGIPPRTPPDRIFEDLRNAVGRRFAVRDVELDRLEAVDQDLVALVVAQPQNMTAREVFSLDQYLAGGGHVLVLYDHLKVALPSWAPSPVESGLDAWLNGLGLAVGKRLLWDERGNPIQVDSRVVETQSGQQQEVPIFLNYGLFPELQDDSLNQSNPATAFLSQLDLLWAHPLQIREVPAGVEKEVLLQSSKRSWALPLDVTLSTSPGNLQALKAHAISLGPGRSYPLAVALSGSFPSQFLGKEIPPVTNPEAEEEQTAPPGSEASALRSAEGQGLLVLIGDSDLFRNEVLRQSPAQGSFAENLFDWLGQNADLIHLRMRGRKDREIRNFYQEYVEEEGAFATTDEEKREVDRGATRYQRGRQRQIAWLLVLGPAVLVLGLGLLRWRWRQKAAAKPYQAQFTSGSSTS